MAKSNVYTGDYAEVRGASLPTLSVTPTLTVHATYAAGDYVGTSGVAMVFTGAALAAGAGGFLNGATLIDGSAAVGVAGELWVFNALVTPPDDSAAWSISDADAKKLVAVIPLSTYYASALNCVSQGQPDGGAKHFYSADGNLYGCLVTRGAPAYASGDVTIILSVVPD
jgi:hypothetical protein